MGDPITTAVLVAATAYSTYEASEAQNDMAAASKEASKAQAASNKVEQARSRRQNLRQARLQRASVEAAGAAEGTTGSSGALATVDTMAGRVSEQSAASAQQVANVNYQAKVQQEITDLQARQQMFQTISGISGSLSGMSMQYGTQLASTGG